MQISLLAKTESGAETGPKHSTKLNIIKSTVGTFGRKLIPKLTVFGYEAKQFEQ